MLIEFDEYKQKLGAMHPKLDELGAALDLDSARSELAELDELSSRDGFWNDVERSQKVLQRTKQLKDKISNFEALVNLLADAETLCELAIEEDDDSLIDELKAEYDKLAEKVEDATLATLLSGDYDHNNAIVTFHAGAGGTEAQDWAQMLFRMYTRWAERRGFKWTTLDYLDGDEAGIKSATISIEGENAYGYLKGENGVHRLVRISPYDAAGRRHTSFSAVEVMPEITDTDEIEIRDEDLRVDTYRSGGAGGQHVNKTESAIRITHLPTGLVVECQDERSQHKNKERAMRILRSRLYDKLQSEQSAAIAAERKSQVGTGDRSERIRTYNFPQGRVTDHRIGLSLYKLEAILGGDMDELIDALVTADRAEKLKNAEG